MAIALFPWSCRVLLDADPELISPVFKMIKSSKAGEHVNILGAMPSLIVAKFCKSPVVQRCHCRAGPCCAECPVGNDPATW